MMELKKVYLGLLLAVITILYGQLLGVVFGLNEDAIKNQLKSSAVEMQESIYKNDLVAMKSVLDKSWSYMQRAHLHAGAMGTTALALILLISFIPTSKIFAFLVSLGLGGGAFGYSCFWMWAGFRAPALGSTSAAKESLVWLAMPTSGAFVAASTIFLLFLLFKFRPAK